MNKTVASLFAQSQFHMTDITRKASSFRRAIATGRILVGAVEFAGIKDHALPKDAVLKLAEIADVQGAKLAWQQLPMCHLGSWFSTEFKKELLNIGESLAGQILFLDALGNNVRKIPIPRDPICSCCGRLQMD